MLRGFGRDGGRWAVVLTIASRYPFREPGDVLAGDGPLVPVTAEELANLSLQGSRRRRCARSRPT